MVCVAGLPRPPDHAERQRLFRFLHGIARRGRSDDGTCHAHLGVASDAELADVVEPLFEDAVEASEDAASTGQ